MNNGPHNYKVVLGLTQTQIQELERWQRSARLAGTELTKQQLLMKMLEHGYSKVNSEIRGMEEANKLKLVRGGDGPEPNDLGNKQKLTLIKK